MVEDKVNFAFCIIKSCFIPLISLQFLTNEYVWDRKLLNCIRKTFLFCFSSSTALILFLILQRVQAHLDISYNASTNNEFNLLMYGDACIPQVALLQPVMTKSSTCALSFPLTYVGEMTSQNVQIKNVGEIPCKAILDMTINDNKCFVLETCEDSIKFLNLNVPGNGVS